MGNIQNAALSAIGSTERAIGVMKYFANEEMKQHQEEVNAYIQKKGEEVEAARAATGEAKKNFEKTVEENKKKYFGANANIGLEKNLIAFHDLTKANLAYEQVQKNYVGIVKQREGSIFGQAKLASAVRKDRLAPVKEAYQEAKEGTKESKEYEKETRSLAKEMRRINK